MYYASSLVSTLLLGSAAALPSFQDLEERQTPGNHEFQAPGPNDSRAPCPALNTLANHGFLPRDGRNIPVETFQDGFLNGFGIANDVISVAINNAFSVCRNVTGEQCQTLNNLTLLATPHMFEHDHSLSRQDFLMAFSDEPVDNKNFNASIFQTTLDVLDGSFLMEIPQANEVRLERESLSLARDFPGWFLENVPTTTFEIGFIYAIMSDFNLPDLFENPRVRVDWWSFWFANESFPTSLGWRPPNPPRNVSFVSSVSSRVLAAAVSSTPSPLPSDALGSFPGPVNATNVNIPALPTKRAIKKRAVDMTDLDRAIAAAGPPPDAPNMYNVQYSPDQMGGFAASKQAWMDKVDSYLSSAGAGSSPAGGPVSTPGGGFSAPVTATATPTPTAGPGQGVSSGPQGGGPPAPTGYGPPPPPNYPPPPPPSYGPPPKKGGGHGHGSGRGGGRGHGGGHGRGGRHGGGRGRGGGGAPHY